MKNNKTSSQAEAIIKDLSGMDPKFRQSSKYAAMEIKAGGRELYELIFNASLNSTGNGAQRCAEACARAAEMDPSIAEGTGGKVVSAILKNTEGGLRYFLCVQLLYVKIPKAAAQKCAKVIVKWIKKETGKGPKAAFLEAIAHMAGDEPKLEPLAVKLLDEALLSDVPSYSARARQIIMRRNRNHKS